jgi:hypothetical protein
MTIKREGRSLILLNGRRGKRSFPNEWSKEEVDKFIKWKNMKKRLTKIMIEREEDEKNKKLLRNYDVKKTVKSRKDSEERDYPWKPHKSREGRKEDRDLETTPTQVTSVSSLSTSSLLLPDVEETTREKEVEAPVVGSLPRGRMGVFIDSGMDVFERIHNRNQGNNTKKGDNNQMRVNEYRTLQLTTTTSSYRTSMNSSISLAESDNSDQSKIREQKPDYLRDDDNNGIWIRIRDDNRRKPLHVKEGSARQLKMLSRRKRQARFFIPFFRFVNKGVELPSIFIRLLSLLAPKSKF